MIDWVNYTKPVTNVSESPINLKQTNKQINEPDLNNNNNKKNIVFIMNCIKINCRVKYFLKCIKYLLLIVIFVVV